MPSQIPCSEVLASEVRAIEARRGGRLDRGLIGLAISGGGIRSATFGLGVLESLKACGLLKNVDVLSTVSGGGYIGAWLSASCRRHAAWLEPDADWRKSIAHLRRYSNYLSPQVGFFSADTWSMATIWFRNTLLIQTTVVLAIACALLIPRPLIELFQWWPSSGNLRWATIILFVLGAVGIAGNQMRLTSEHSVYLLRAKSWWAGLALAVVLGATAWLYGVWMDFDPFVKGEVSYRTSAPIAALIVLAGFVLQPVAVRLVALAYPRESAPQQINYTQGWVQIAIVVPMMAAGYLVAAVLWGEVNDASGVQGLSGLKSYGTLAAAAWRHWPFPLAVVFASFWLLSFCAVDSRRNWKSLLAALAAPMVAVPILHALLSVVVLFLHQWAGDAEGARKAFVWAPPLVTLSFVLSIVVLIGMMGRQSTDEVREWWSRLGAWLGIYATAWMVITLSAVYGPRLVQWAVDQHPWTSLTAGGGWIGTIIAGLFAGNSETTGTQARKSAGTKAKEVVAAIAPFLFIAGLLIGVAYALHQIVVLNAGEPDWPRMGAPESDSVAPFLRVSLVALAVAAAGVILMAARVDINEFSLNAFYRNRLVRCYLGATRFRPGERNPQNFTGFDGADDITLAELGTGGPLHLVNCALNLGGSSDLALHTRHSASFTLSPLHCGSAHRSRAQSGEAAEIGYVPTPVFGGAGTPTLGQAISVSGAAASPNMGYHTSPVVAFLLTLFNVRLGWWFPNPSKGDAAVPSPHFSLRYLVAELFGGAHDKSRFVMVSDGGHFENLAAYELVRRRCRVVIISDAECDPTLAFDGLGTLIRMCEVDFKTKISIDVSALRPGSAPWSSNRWAVGRIEYGEGIPDGTLIYLKASMTGREDTAVLQYKSSHPLFPHESTGDQFYGEDQFESYRRLGRDVGADAFHAVSKAPPLIELALN
jgi:hypothetical protein